MLNLDLLADSLSQTFSQQWEVKGQSVAFCSSPPVSRKPLPPIPGEERKNERVSIEQPHDHTHVQQPPSHATQAFYHSSEATPSSAPSDPRRRRPGRRWWRRRGGRGGGGGAVRLPGHRAARPESGQRRRVRHLGEVWPPLVQGAQQVWVSVFESPAESSSSVLLKHGVCKCLQSRYMGVDFIL